MRKVVRRDLEGLRAIAVLGVVVYHLRPSWLPGGFVGVDIFFVLSGFLITSLLLRESTGRAGIDLWAFWGRRARRLLPAAAVVMIATVLASLLLVNSIDAKRFAVDGAYAALFSVNWHHAALGTSYLADSAPTPLMHYWSLGVEEQFYVLWPVLLVGLAVLARRRGSIRRWTGVIAAAVIVSSFLLAWRLTAGDQPYAYFATYTRAWQLALGAVIAASVPRLARWPIAARTVARWAGVAAIVGFFIAAPLDVIYPGWLAIIPAAGAAAIIVAGLPRAAGAAGSADVVWLGLSSAPAQLIGRYSYGWYLWHWPPLVLLPLILDRPLRGRELLACAVATLLMAALSYHVLEHPVRSSRALSARRGRGSLVLGAAIVAVSLIVAQTAGVLADRRTDGAHVRTAHGKLLIPQPGDAATEQPRPLADGCEVGLSEAELAPECRYRADSGHGDVVLVGDSHAAQWFSAVDSIAGQLGWGLRVWTRASCPFADISKLISGGPSTNCNAWRDDVMTRLVNTRPSLVIVASYASKVPTLYDRSTGKLVGGKGAQKIYKQGLRRELTRLRAAGIAVLLIRDNPSFDETAPKCVLAHKTNLSACSEPLHHALRTAADLHAARDVAGVHILDITSILCPAQRCQQVIGSTLAYRDDNHLTLEMIQSLEPRLAAAVHTLL